MYKFIDLFSGIGGLRSGFELNGGKCVFTSERDKFALQTYSRNFDVSHIVNTDITKISEDEIPEHDVLLGGFPCQPFSISGVSKKNSMNRPHGFLDQAQGTLFFDVARILQHHRPKAFVLENVKNLISHDKGNTFKVILTTLEELSYKVQFRIIDARHWVPQHRERIFIIGFRDSNGFSIDDIEKLYPSKRRILNDILHPEDGSEDSEEPYTFGESAVVNDKYTLSDKLWSYLQHHKERHALKGNGFGYGLVDRNSHSRTLSARYYKDGSEILVPRGEGNPRRLTPRECSRLMGFDAFSKFKIPVSDTQAYRQFGNSVSPLVSNSLSKLMEDYL